MIYYDWEKEVWRSSDNDSFNVDMTPDAGDILEHTFDNEEVFWKWYSENCGDKAKFLDDCITFAIKQHIKAKQIEMANLILNICYM